MQGGKEVSIEGPGVQGLELERLLRLPINGLPDCCMTGWGPPMMGVPVRVYWVTGCEGV